MAESIVLIRFPDAVVLNVTDDIIRFRITDHSSFFMASVLRRGDTIQVGNDESKYTIIGFRVEYTSFFISARRVSNG